MIDEYVDMVLIDKIIEAMLPGRRARQPREHAVPCWRCKRMTWNLDAQCTACRERFTNTKEQA